MSKLTYEYIKEYIESFGYKLISSEYINSREKLNMKCCNGHIISMNWDNFKYGKRCRECANKKLSDERKFNYEDVKKKIELMGLKLISDKYESNNKNLKLICSCGNEFERSYNNLLKNQKCTKCKVKKSKKFTYDYVKKFIENEGYELLSKEYNGCNENLEVRCEKNHKPYKVKFSNFKNGKRCPHCNGGIKHDFEYIKNEIEKNSYKLISKEYINSKSKLDMLCEKGHKCSISWSDFKSGVRCKICVESNGEKEIMKYLDSKNITYLFDCKYFNDLISPLGNKLRPDFILPDRKIWIEYDGEFHYRDMYNDGSYEKLKSHDKLKDEYAKRNGWNLIRIPYWEFDNIEKILEII